MRTAGGWTRQQGLLRQKRPRRRRPEVQVHMRGLLWLVPLLLLLGLATPPCTRAREVDVGSLTPRRLRRARHHRQSSGGGVSKAAAGSEGGCVRFLVRPLDRLTVGRQQRGPELDRPFLSTCKHAHTYRAQKGGSWVWERQRREFYGPVERACKVCVIDGGAHTRTI